LSVVLPHTYWRNLSSSGARSISNDLAVSDAHRRRGVATGTINALRKIAARQGASVIFVQADLEDGPAIAFYRSLGTMKLAHHFDIEVGTIKDAG